MKRNGYLVSIFIGIIVFSLLYEITILDTYIYYANSIPRSQGSRHLATDTGQSHVDGVDKIHSRQTNR